jgi:hypothetical protein
MTKVVIFFEHDLPIGNKAAGWAELQRDGQKFGENFVASGGEAQFQGLMIVNRIIDFVEAISRFDEIEVTFIMTGSRGRSQVK